MKIAAAQIDVKFADVNYNLIHTEEIIKQARCSNVELLVLPEFFTSAIGFSDAMLDVVKQNDRVHCLMCDWADRYNMIIGGSYICFEEENAYNVFELIFPGGVTYRHKKDIPTQFENCYYTNGDKEHVLYTSIGNIGIALCWEMLRYDTVRRLAGKVDFILSCSCWWDLPDDAPKEREELREYNQRLALNTPLEFAKLLKVPLIHANHCGKITASNFPKNDEIKTRQYVGAAQIIDQDGLIIDRRCFYKGEGLAVADLCLSKSNRTSNIVYPDAYWIPELPDSYINAWNTINPLGKVYYEKRSLPYYKK